MIRLFRKNSIPGPVSRTDALKCRPVKHPRISEETLEAGVVLVSYPLRTRPWIARIARRLDPGPEKPVIKKLQLDEMGSAAWRLIDGRRTVARIIREFRDVYQLHHKEAEVSVTLFIRELGKRGIIGLNPGTESEPESENGSENRSGS